MMAERSQDSSQDEPSFEEDYSDESTDVPPMSPVPGSQDEPRFESESDVPAAVRPGQGTATSDSEEDEYGWFDAPSAEQSSRSGPRHLGRTGPFWLIAGGVLILILFLVWLGLSQNTPAEEPFELTDSPATGLAGSITVESELPPTPTPTPEATPVPALGVGQTVLVANTDGDGIRLRGEPNVGSVTLEIFAEGDEFVVLDPGSEFQAYPVESDGYGWYRIRSTSGESSGLVGWAAGDFLAPASE